MLRELLRQVLRNALLEAGIFILRQAVYRLDKFKHARLMAAANGTEGLSHQTIGLVEVMKNKRYLRGRQPPDMRRLELFVFESSRGSVVHDLQQDYATKEGILETPGRAPG